MCPGPLEHLRPLPQAWGQVAPAGGPQRPSADLGGLAMVGMGRFTRDSVYLGSNYNTDVANLSGLETMAYAVFAQGEQRKGDSHDGETKEEADLVRYRKWAMREPGGNAYSQGQVDDCNEWFQTEDPKKRVNVPDYIKQRRQNKKAARKNGKAARSKKTKKKAARKKAPKKKGAKKPRGKAKPIIFVCFVYRIV